MIEDALHGAPGTAVVFSPSLMEGLALAWNGHGRHAVREDDRRWWKEVLSRLETELRLPAPGHLEAAYALARIIIIEAGRLAGRSPSAPRPQILVDAGSVIDERFRGPLSLADVAAALSVSRSHLGRLVRDAMGCSVGDWIRERRMQEARRLLRDTTAPIDSIAAKSGYRDVAHFRRDFQRAHDTTPARWRERARPDLGSRIR